MKKLSLFWLILLLFLPAITLGQALSFGVMGGATLPKITGDDIESTAVYPGFTAGVCLNIHLHPVLSIQTEVLYVQKGWKDDGGKYRINYLEAPVLAKYTWVSRVNPYFIIGPAVAARLSTRAEIKVDETMVTGSFNEIIKTTDVGLVLGAGIYPKVPDAYIEIRYTMGLNTVDDSGLDLDMKNGDIALLVGYRLF